MYVRAQKRAQDPAGLSIRGIRTTHRLGMGPQSSLESHSKVSLALMTIVMSVGNFVLKDVDKVFPNGDFFLDKRRLARE
jgi:hypothetical protein